MRGVADIKDLIKHNLTREGTYLSHDSSSWTLLEPESPPLLLPVLRTVLVVTQSSTCGPPEQAPKLQLAGTW